MYRFYFQTTEASAGEEAVEAAAQAGGSLASGMAGMAMMGMIIDLWTFLSPIP